jgi:hypothetical protein
MSGQQRRRQAGRRARGRCAPPRLVDLKVLDVLHAHARVRDGLGQRRRRRGGEPRGVLLGVAEAAHGGEHLAAVLLGGGARHEHEGRRAVGDGRRVGGGDGAALLEGGAALGGGLGRGGRLVVHAHHHVALAPLDRDGHHLAVEAARLVRRARARVRRVRVLVLHLLRDLVRVRAQLGVPAHVAVAVRVPQPVGHLRGARARG